MHCAGSIVAESNFAMSIVARSIDALSIGEKSIVAEFLCCGLECC